MTGPIAIILVLVIMAVLAPCAAPTPTPTLTLQQQDTDADTDTDTDTDTGTDTGTDADTGTRKPIAWLHVGPGKTGTTAFQLTIIQNKVVLNATAGISMIGEDDAHCGFSYHAICLDSAEGSAVVRQIEQCSSDIVLSSECFSSKKLVYSKEHEEHITCTQRLVYLLQCYDVRVLLWHRSWLSKWISEYSQQMKGMESILMDGELTYLTHLLQAAPGSGVSSTIRPWANSFPANKVYVFSFEGTLLAFSSSPAPFYSAFLHLTSGGEVQSQVEVQSNYDVQSNRSPPLRTVTAFAWLLRSLNITEEQRVQAQCSGYVSHYLHSNPLALYLEQVPAYRVTLAPPPSLLEEDLRASSNANVQYLYAVEDQGIYRATEGVELVCESCLNRVGDFYKKLLYKLVYELHIEFSKRCMGDISRILLQIDKKNILRPCSTGALPEPLELIVRNKSKDSDEEGEGEGDFWLSTWGGVCTRGASAGSDEQREEEREEA